jgi:dihydroceramidase
MPITHNFTASPPNQPGFFSPATAAANFCEIDYAITPYLAEFINSLTNLTYIYYALTTLPLSSSPFNPLTYPLTNTSLLLVGLGSFAFHATLKHIAQICDELAMYAIVSSLNYAVYSHRMFTSQISRFILGSVLLFSTGVVGYVNLISPTGARDDIHNAIFVVLLTTFWPRVLWLINHAGPSSPTPPATNPKQSSPRQKATRHHQLSRFRFSAFSFLAGFAIWLIDGLYCYQLRAIREKIGLPFAWLLEFHGVWHVLTAVGAGGFVRLVGELTTTAEGRGEGVMGAELGGELRKAGGGPGRGRGRGNGSVEKRKFELEKDKDSGMRIGGWE